jgi:hypothetical protein
MPAASRILVDVHIRYHHLPVDQGKAGSTSGRSRRLRVDQNEHLSLAFYSCFPPSLVFDLPVITSDFYNPPTCFDMAPCTSTSVWSLVVVVICLTSASQGTPLEPRANVIPAGYVALDYYPTPHGGWASDWSASYAKARALVEKMTLAEKTNITAGTGIYMGTSILARVFKANLPC